MRIRDWTTACLYISGVVCVHATAADASEGFQYERHFSTKTPYFYNGFDSERYLNQCKDIHLQGVVRHGARNPGPKDVELMSSLQELVEANINRISTKSELEWMKSWKSSYLPEDIHLLTDVGEKELHIIPNSKRRSTRNTPVKTVSKHFVEPKKSRPQSTVNPEDFFGSKPVERGSKVKSAHKSAQKGGKSKTDSTKAEFDSEKAKVEAEMIDLDGDDDAEVIAPKRKRAKSPTPPVSVAPAPAKRAKKAGALAGKTYVITGKMNTFSSTSDIRDLVEEKDGRLLADTMDNFAVARYCVVGTDPDTAMVKVAEEAQVEVIDEFVLCKQLAMPSQANKARRMVKEHNKEREKAEKASRKMKVDKPAKPAAVDTMDVDEPEPPKKSGYQVMMAREPPNALGSRAIPALKTGCFSGLTFCFSGVLDTISKLDYTELVTSHGGRVTGSVSGKTSYLVSGRDGGETKVAKAKEVGCKVIDEDGFYALLDTHMSKDQSNAKPAHVLTEEENEAKAASKQSHFRAMMNREGPKALGTRDIPTCKDMCFVDTTFVFSGIMDTISSDDAKELVKQYGGR
ncbi:hypothetical protein SARC_10424 [Sphaeroforma arctica JP610]|uniref:BRCT domain-containing protein n=1 Tax=Sphaeroforma arctica JP610 TaxID=667725 RepID=A0A0L0FKX5_9EUKA|nr:hypothetical protein SARC_10424 [Sphaeroforma arctica JP610]KNC77106.1 hypothetical protein SARC_10424 [Sphaeroforma arctica JP610]|eukprot:XP_014151008.1 hypothetical protein SARC_10424 [Sphaeroforma arctica JP610]